MDLGIKGFQLEVGRVEVGASFCEGEGEGLFGMAAHELLEDEDQLMQGRSFMLSAQAAVEDGLQFLGHADVVQLPGADEVDEFALLVGSGEGAEEEHDHHGQAEDVGPVVVLLAGRLFRRTEQLRPHRLAELFLALPLSLHHSRFRFFH
jgi:hypothetical protein